LKSLNCAIARKAAEGHTLQRHISAQQLIEGCRVHADEAYGESAKVELEKLGIRTGSDVGTIIFLLIGAGVLGKRPEEKREDFDGLHFL